MPPLTARAPPVFRFPRSGESAIVRAPTVSDLDRTTELAAGTNDRAAVRSFWRHVVGSLRGEHHDYTKGSLHLAILLLAVPMVLEMGLESLFALVDIWWVNRIDDGWFGAVPTHGAAAATIGTTEGMLAIVYAIALGFGMAVTALVARRVGEKDLPGAAVAGGQAIGLGLVAGAVMGLPAIVWAPELLSLMNDGNEKVVAVGTEYARIILGANVIVMLLFLQNAIFRGAGDPILALKTLAVANCINLVLDPFLIFGIGPFPELGVTVPRPRRVRAARSPCSTSSGCCGAATAACGSNASCASTRARCGSS
jgi:hypothetical protein